MLFAFRSQTDPGFNRDGVRFSFDHWLLVEDPTEAQLNEKRLLRVSYDQLPTNEFWRQIGPLPIVNPELLPENAPVDNFTEHLVRSMATANRLLAMENRDLKGGLDAANAKVRQVFADYVAMEEKNIQLITDLEALRSAPSQLPTPKAEDLTVSITADTSNLQSAIADSPAQIENKAREIAPDDVVVSSEADAANYAPGHNETADPTEPTDPAAAPVDAVDAVDAADAAVSETDAAPVPTRRAAGRHAVAATVDAAEASGGE